MDHDLKTESRNLTLGDASVVDARGGPGKTGLSAASRWVAASILRAVINKYEHLRVHGMNF